MKVKELIPIINKFNHPDFLDLEVAIQFIGADGEVDHDILSFAGFTQSEPYCVMLGTSKAAEYQLNKKLN